jgi:hypothetical protein
MAANNEYAYRQGGTSGQIYNKVMDHYQTNEAPKVRILGESQGRDSGGPYFTVDSEGYAWRVGIHAHESYTDDGRDAAAGNTFYYAETYLNVQ